MSTSSTDHSKLESRTELLRYSPTSPIVYERWVKAQYAQAGIKYGIHATLFLTGVRHTPPMPIQPEGYEQMAANNPNAVLFLKRVSAYANAVETASSTDQKLFGQMWANLSEDSINRVSRVHPVDQFVMICTQMDAQALLLRIRQAHQGAGATIPVINWHAASMSFYSLQQETNEDISVFKARFDASLRTMEALAHPGIPNQALVPAQFLGALSIGASCRSQRTKPSAEPLFTPQTWTTPMAELSTLESPWVNNHK